MSFELFVSMLKARRWAATATFVLVLASAIAISLWLPRQYTATASVVIDARTDPISATGQVGMALPSFMATQVDIMNSDRVALRVIRDLKLDSNADLRAQWQEDTGGNGTFEQWLTVILHKQLDVKPSRESNVVTLDYKSPDPRFAAALANAFAQAYIKTTLELRTDPARQYNQFFVTQTQDARQALEQAQGKLSAFQKAKGIIATDERLDVESARLNELSSQLTQLQAIAADSRSRQAAAQGGQADRMQEVLGNPLIASLKADLSRNQGRLEELRQRLGDAHPQVREAQASTAELRSRIETETRRVSSGVGVSNRINEGRAAQLSAALAAQRSKLLELKAVRDEGVVLQREAETAQRIYENLTARLSQSSLEAQATQGFANVLTVAQAPVEPSSPRLLLNTVLAVLVGMLLGIGAALALELSDRRLRTSADVVAMLGLPVLGTLPVPGARRYVAGYHGLPPPARPHDALRLSPLEG